MGARAYQYVTQGELRMSLAREGVFVESRIMIEIPVAFFLKNQSQRSPMVSFGDYG